MPRYAALIKRPAQIIQRGIVVVRQTPGILGQRKPVETPLWTGHGSSDTTPLAQSAMLVHDHTITLGEW